MNEKQPKRESIVSPAPESRPRAPRVIRPMAEVIEHGKKQEFKERLRALFDAQMDAYEAGHVSEADAMEKEIDALTERIIRTKPDLKLAQLAKEGEDLNKTINRAIEEGSFNQVKRLVAQRAIWINNFIQREQTLKALYANALDQTSPSLPEFPEKMTEKDESIEMTDEEKVA